MICQTFAIQHELQTLVLMLKFDGLSNFDKGQASDTGCKLALLLLTMLRNHFAARGTYVSLM